jgi:hypothetical protein
MSQHEDTCSALALCILANVPVILWGPPGNGKTSVVEQIAADYGMHLETVIASIREPSDFAGLPIVDGSARTVTLAPPRWAQSLADAPAGSGLAFFDEISTAPPAVQAALLRPIIDRVVGDLALPRDTRVVAAANPPDIAADGWDLAPPMANRFCHLNWSLPADVVREGFATGWAPIAFPVVDPTAVERAFHDAKVVMASFLGSRPELVTKMPDSSDESGRAFPTPRSWEMAALLYATATAANANTNVVNLLVIGTVGLAAANEFLTYAANLDLPDPEVLLADPTSLTVPSDRGDKVYAIAASVWSATSGNLTVERWGACGHILAVIADANHADIAFAFGRRWATARPQGAMVSPTVIASLGPLLAEMGALTATVA